MSARADRTLRAVAADAKPSVLFCGHCGLPPEDAAAAATRVCARCGLGLVLGAARNVAPAPDEPFLAVDGHLGVCAMSRLAEELLGVSEIDAVNRHIAEFLVPADAEAAGAASLMALLVAAATDEAAMHRTVVRPTREFGVRYWARVGACGPPRAALLVLSDECA